jgi:putative transposase
MNPNKGRGYVYILKYHVVFCVKYRHQILKNQIEQDLRDIFLELAKANGFQIETMEIMPDHVHMLLNCTPQHYIPDVLKALKGPSARFLFKKYPEMKKKLWGGHLWNPSYFISSVGEASEDAVRKYIESQKEGEPD